MSLREPLHFVPLSFQKIWGGRRLEDYVEGELDAEGPVGEVWQLVDRLECASVVAEGPFAGRSLRGLMLSESEALLGRSTPGESGSFPLLVKLLEAAKPLSVQVHPDAVAAQTLGGGAEAKDECWYILAAEDGAEVMLGLKPDTDARKFAACAAGHAVVDCLQTFPVRAGQFVAVPAGTVHSIGAGVTLVEVQQNSDTTFRLWDWNRDGLGGEKRDTHVEEALRSIDFESAVEGPRDPQFEVIAGVNRRARLLDGAAFAVELLEIHEALEHDTDGRAWVYVVLNGSARLRLAGAEDDYAVVRGQTWLLPADAGVHRFDSADGEMRVLRVEAKERAES